MDANIVFYLFLIAVGIGAGIWFIGDFDRIPERWKYAINLFIAVLGFVIGLETIEHHIEVTVVEETVNEIDAILKVKIEEIIREKEEEWKEREEDRNEKILNLIVQSRDSLLVNIARLDTCVDKHFAYLHRRLDKLELEK